MREPCYGGEYPLTSHEGTDIMTVTEYQFFRAGCKSPPAV